MARLGIGLLALLVIGLATAPTEAASPRDIAAVAAATSVGHPWGPRAYYGPVVRPHVYRPAYVAPVLPPPPVVYPRVYGGYRTYYYGSPYYGAYPYYGPSGSFQYFGPGGGISIGW